MFRPTFTGVHVALIVKHVRTIDVVETEEGSQAVIWMASDESLTRFVGELTLLPAS